MTLLAEQLDSVLPWHISEFGIDKFVWPTLENQPAIKVGVVDTGVAPHPELDGKIAASEDFTGNLNGPRDGNGHGTHVAGIIAAKTFGVNKHAQLVIAKALNDNGSGSDRNIARGLQYCFDQGCRVINLSAGSSVKSPMIVGVMQDLAQQGALFAVAAGNDGSEMGSPADEPCVFGVTALTRQRKIADYSNRGEAADVAAPGSEIRSLGRGGAYVIMSGTSMASPFVAGYISAYCVKMGKVPTFNDVMKWLTNNSIDLGKPGRDWEYGLGLPNPETGFASPTMPTKPPTAPVGTVPKSVLITMSDGQQLVFTNPKAV